MPKRFLGNIALLLTASIWGVSFVAQKTGMDFVGPFTFNFVRSIIGGFSLLPLIFIAKYLTNDTRTQKRKTVQRIRVAQAGISCGLALFFGMSVQQYCMLYATAGKAGFISALYIVMVPIISMFLFKHKLGRHIIISVILAVMGLYLLCFKLDDGGFSFYDLLLLVGAFFYGIHILVVNHFSEKVEPVRTSCVQFFVVGLLSLPLMLLFENPTLASIIAGKVPILYAGILTCGVAYTLQIVGQKYTTPVVATIILCSESVFAVLGGALILGEVMNCKEILGCVLMISAILLSQLKQNK